MKKERLLFLHEEFKKAIEFCNEIDENELFSDLETAEDNFLSDVFMLAFFPICADRNISETELEKFKDSYLNHSLLQKNSQVLTENTFRRVKSSKTFQKTKV